jgi:tetratricopeptide (TPR) repeat protein
MRLSFPGLFIAVLLGLPSPIQSADKAPDYLRYFEALRARQLFVLAEDYAGALLADQALTGHLRSELTVELSQILFDHGALTTGTQQQELWQAARNQLEELRRSTTPPAARRIIEIRLTLLTAQAAFVHAIDALADPDDAVLRQQAVRHLQQAIVELSGAITMNDPGTDGNTPSDLDAELSGLRQQLHFQLAEIEVRKGELSDRGTERSALLLDAAERSEALLRARPQSHLQRKLKVLQACIARLQGEDMKAGALLDAAEKAGLDQSERDHLLAERMRLERSRQKLDAALQIYAARIQSAIPPSDEFRAAAVEALLDSWKLANAKGDAALQKQLLDEAISQHEQTSGIWRKFTAAKIERLNQDRELGSELAALVRKAASAWQAGEPDAAVKHYGEAAGLAHQRGQPKQAFELAYTRGSILLQMERWQQAQLAFEELVKNFPDNPQTPQADLLRCYAIGRSSSQAEDFHAALQQHLLKFPDAPTAGDALWMLGNAEEQHHHSEAAIAAYSQIAANHARKDEADLRVTILLQQMLDPESTMSSGGDWDNLSAREIARISTRVADIRDPLTPRQCRILLNCVRLIIEQSGHDVRAADELLQRVDSRLKQARQAASQSGTSLEEDWKPIERQLVQLQVVLLACQGHLDRARAILQRYQTADPTVLLSILAGLSDFNHSIDPRCRQDLGYLQRLSTRDLALRRSELTPEQRRLLDESAAQAAVAMEDWAEAISLYEQLLRESPQDRGGLQRLIRLSIRRGEVSDLQRAKELWSRIERQEPAGTVAWIEARLEITDLLLRLGDATAARKLLGVTRTLYPAMGTAELKARGDDLWEKCAPHR